MKNSGRLLTQLLSTQQFNNRKTMFSKLQTRLFAVLGLLFLTATLGINTQAQTSETQYFQGFENNINGWDAFGGAFNPTRVPSGNNGVTSKTGSFHAEGGASATNWGGYNSNFPARGYKTSVDVYLDVGGGFANDKRFDFTSAINNNAGSHRRDFAFNGGYYNDSDITGTGPRFVFSASNSTGRANSFPKNPARNPYAITTTGWYTIQHKFYNNGSGVLAVDLSIIDSLGTTLNTWTLSEPTDIIASVIGGNRYGWFANNEFSFLAFDNSQRANFVSIKNVDDDGMASATDCDASDSAFTTIQSAIDDASTLPGDLVNVCPGTYVEDINVNKAGLRVIGADASTTTISGAIGGDGATVRVGASNVTVAKFTITREGNNTTDWNNPGVNSGGGVAVQGQAITNMLLRDNIIVGNRTGIDINNTNGHTIRNNTIDNNRTGMLLRNQTDNLTVVENFIRNNWTMGILFLDASGGSNSPLQQALGSKFNNNDISANWYGQVVERQVGGSLPAPGTTNLKDFRYNWYGTASPIISTANSTEPGYAAQIPVIYGGTATPPGGQPDLLGPASANIFYTPLLSSGTDTDVETTPGRGTNGFQGGPSFLTVTPSMYRGWFYYNDETDVIDNSLGSFVPGPGTPPLGVGSSQISVSGTQRRNLATYQFSGTPLAEITTFEYSTYNPSAGNGGGTNRAGYINFNVDFDGSDTWQRRLIFLPSDNGTVSQDTWQNWDAVNSGNANWRYSGSTWPTGVGGGGEPGSTTKTWSQILSQYPGVRMRVTDSFVGIRVGEPYTDGYTENIDAFKFGNAYGDVTFDFEPARPSVTINQAAGQADPTSTSPINFTVVFSEPVTGFNASSDVALTGTAGATSAVITGGPTTYNVAVTATNSGTVIANVVDSAATANSNGAPSTASTSTDNSVTFFTCNNVSIPTGQTVATNTQFVSPINIDDTTGRNILGYSFTLTYNPAVVTPVAVETASTMSAGWNTTTNNSPGTLNVVVFNPPLGTPLTGSGILLNVRFVASGGITTTSILGLSNFILNEGVPCVATTDGDVTVISGAISGAVTYVNGPGTPGVPNTTITATGSAPPPATMTDSNGLYSLSGFGTGAYTITPSKANQVNGIGNSDATAVAQHIVGFITLNSTQLLAADVTQNGTVSSLDATYIAQYAALIANPSFAGTWKFIPPSRSYPNVQTNQTNQNYSAILLGEVTGNWSPTGPLRPSLDQSNKADRTAKGEKPNAVVSVNLPANKFATQTTNFDIDLTVSDTTGEVIFGYEFDLYYNSSVILPQLTPCESAGTLSAGRSVTCNPVTPGRLRVVVFSTSGVPISGAGTLLRLKFNAIGAPATISYLRFQSSPTPPDTFIFNEGIPQDATTDGQVTISSPTAASVGIGGRLLSAMGRGVSNARVTLTDTTGEVRTTISNPFGYYRFEDVEVGQTYTIGVSSKRYRFTPQTVSIVENLTNIDLIAEP